MSQPNTEDGKKFPVQCQKSGPKTGWVPEQDTVCLSSGQKPQDFKAQALAGLTAKGLLTQDCPDVLFP